MAISANPRQEAEDRLDAMIAYRRQKVLNLGTGPSNEALQLIISLQQVIEILGELVDDEEESTEVQTDH